MRYLIILLIGLILLSGCEKEITGNSCLSRIGCDEKNGSELLDSISDDVYIMAEGPISADYFITIGCTDTPVYLKYDDYQVNMTMKELCNRLQKSKELIK